MAAVIAHFHVVKGRAYSFRFKDWNDYEAADQAANAKACVDFVLANPQWKLSVQTHKVLGID